MEQKSYEHLNVGYVSHIEGTSKAGERYEKKQVEFNPKNQETRDILAASLASGKGLYFEYRQKPNPTPFAPDQYGRVKTTIGYLSLSQSDFDRLKS